MAPHYEKSIFTTAVQQSKTYAELLIKLGLRAAGGNYKTAKKYVQAYDLDVSHFEGGIIKADKLLAFIKGQVKPLGDILTANSSYSRTSLKARLFKEGLKVRECEMCGQGELWYGQKMSLILDHKNGVHNDNRLENLRIVCPNCNATLDTHCGRITKAKRQQAREESRLRVVAGHMRRRKVVRPPVEVIRIEVEQLGYSAVGRKYGVSDNAIRKWTK